jgi:hypothetical protein
MIALIHVEPTADDTRTQRLHMDGLPYTVTTRRWWADDFEAGQCQRSLRRPGRARLCGRHDRAWPGLRRTTARPTLDPARPTGRSILPAWPAHHEPYRPSPIGRPRDCSLTPSTVPARRPYAAIPRGPLGLACPESPSLTSPRHHPYRFFVKKGSGHDHSLD